MSNHFAPDFQRMGLIWYGKDSFSKIHLSFLQILCQSPPHYPGICPLKGSNISAKVWGQRGHHLISDNEIKMASIPKWVVEATIHSSICLWTEASLLQWQGCSHTFSQDTTFIFPTIAKNVNHHPNFYLKLQHYSSESNTESCCDQHRRTVGSPTAEHHIHTEWLPLYLLSLTSRHKPHTLRCLSIRDCCIFSIITQ